MEANKFVLVHQNSIGASFGLNALSGKKEKEKEEVPESWGKITCGFPTLCLLIVLRQTFIK